MTQTENRGAWRGYEKTLRTANQRLAVWMSIGSSLRLSLIPIRLLLHIKRLRKMFLVK